MSKPEIYVSIDIETDGPAPSLNSMLALGAAAFDENENELGTWYSTLTSLTDAQQNPDTMAWWQTQPEAWSEVNKNCRYPGIAIPDFVSWCENLPGKPVAVGWPIAFDFAYVNYYCWLFMNRNPLGFSGLDIRSYEHALADRTGVAVSDLHASVEAETDISGLLPHVAVDDAVKQGRWFMALRRRALQRGMLA